MDFPNDDVYMMGGDDLIPSDPDSDEDAEEEIDVVDEVFPENQNIPEQNSLMGRMIPSNSLMGRMVQFLDHTSARDFVFEESATLRLVKALHKTKIEDVILAIEQGARINFEVCLMV